VNQGEDGVTTPNSDQFTVRVSKTQIAHEPVPTENARILDQAFTVGHVHADWDKDGTLVVTLFEPNAVDPALIDKGQKTIEIRTKDSYEATTNVAAACCHFYHLASEFTASRIEAKMEGSKLVLILCQ
jgi:hypothetical protein